jgi:hypothetical protein
MTIACQASGDAQILQSITQPSNFLSHEEKEPISLLTDLDAKNWFDPGNRSRQVFRNHFPREGVSSNKSFNENGIQAFTPDSHSSSINMNHLAAAYQ